MMILRDPYNAPVDFSVVQATQRHVAPSRQLIAMCESNQWTVVSSTNATLAIDTANAQAGAGSLQISFNGTGATATIQRPQSIDLSRFAPTDLLVVYVKASNWASLTSLQMLLLQDAADYFSAGFGTIASDGVATAHPTSGAAWWQWRAQFSQLTKTGAPNLAGITLLQFIAAGVAGATVNIDYWIARYAAGSTGEGGRAPVGADVTCLTPTPLPVNVALTNTLLDDGYTLVDSVGSTNALTLLQASLTAFFQQLRPGMPARFVDVARAVHDTPGWLDFTLSLPAAVGTPLAVPIAITQDAVLGTLTAS
jgi:hypothetical protein